MQDQRYQNRSIVDELVARGSIDNRDIGSQSEYRYGEGAGPVACSNEVTVVV